jgi:hypothetical protein
MVAFFNPLISFLSIYTYCTSEMLPRNVLDFMTDAIRANCKGTTPPSLLPQQYSDSAVTSFAD